MTLGDLRIDSPWWLLLLVVLPLVAWVRRRGCGGRPALMYEHSMGQSLPEFILRKRAAEAAAG